jgi:hypothetical protein
MKDPHNLKDEYCVGVGWSSRSHLMTIWQFAYYRSIAVDNPSISQGILSGLFLSKNLQLNLSFFRDYDSWDKTTTVDDQQ